MVKQVNICLDYQDNKLKHIAIGIPDKITITSKR